MRLTISIIVASILTIGASPALSQSVAWVKDSSGSNVSKPCTQICEDFGGDNMFAVRGGKWKGETPYYVCAGQMEGLRPGYQVTGVFNNACNVGHDGKDKQTVPICLCSSKPIKAE